MNNINPYYVAYAKAHGRTVEEQIEYDNNNGIMTEYILWIDRMRIKFREVSPESFAGDRIKDFDKWSKFLENGGSL